MKWNNSCREIDMNSYNFTELKKLPISEKIQLVVRLWDTIRSDQSKIPVPVSHKQELDKRLETYDSHLLLSLDDLKQKLENQK